MRKNIEKIIYSFGMCTKDREVLSDDDFVFLFLFMLLQIGKDIVLGKNNFNKVLIKAEVLPKPFGKDPCPLVKNKGNYRSFEK